MLGQTPLSFGFGLLHVGFVVTIKRRLFSIVQPGVGNLSLSFFSQA